MFADGRPSNGIAKAGLLFHAFDDTEDYRELWKPCTIGFCVRFSHFWSTSIINKHQPNSFASSGILLAPYSNKVLCSWPEDMAEKEKGAPSNNVETSCDSKFADGAVPYPPEQLIDMLNISMSEGAPPQYNEVIIDSQAYIDSLPNSIAAIAYYDDSSEEEQTKATETYFAMLQAYDLPVGDIPLVKLIREPAHGQPFLEDATAGAEAFLSEQRYQRFRREHPKLGLPPHQRASLQHADADESPAAESSPHGMSRPMARYKAYGAEADLGRAVGTTGALVGHLASGLDQAPGGAVSPSAAAAS